MITIHCHCGNVRLSFESLPSSVRDCDCPMCNRLGALWADFKAGEVTVESDRPAATYRWGDGDYEMHHCATCGCSTHYSATEESAQSETGVNLSMLDRRRLERIPVV